MKVMGFRRSNSTPKDGPLVTGINIYVSYPVTGEGEGMVCDRIYMTDDKLAQCGYTPRVGDDVTVNYNKFGKPASVVPVKR